MSETGSASAERSAASPEAGEAAARLSAAHGWLRFQSTGRPLPRRLTDDVADWQAGVLADHRSWYGADAPSQVSGAFVLQYLLQVPAHTAATAAGAGMRPRALADLTFALGSGGVPQLVEVGVLETSAGDLFERLERARADYRAVAEPLAHAYRSTRPMSSRQRLGMVTDLWAEAARAVRSGAGRFKLEEPRRISCCLIYALPGCVECSGCPRTQVRRGSHRVTRAPGH